MKLESKDDYICIEGIHVTFNPLLRWNVLAILTYNGHTSIALSVSNSRGQAVFFEDESFVLFWNRFAAIIDILSNIHQEAIWLILIVCAIDMSLQF